MNEPPRFVTIRHDLNLFEAQLTCATLEAAGIAVLMQNESFAGTVWTEAIAVGGVQVLVPEESVAQEEAILGPSAHVPADDGAEVHLPEPSASSTPRFRSSCPSCASAGLELFVPLRRLAAALSIVGLPLVPPLKRYRCKACGDVFRRHRHA
jgi:hypothetical protein